MLNELPICISQRKVLVILQVTRVLDHLVWTTSTNCHGQRQSQHTHARAHTTTDRQRWRQNCRQSCRSSWTLVCVKVFHSHLLKLFSIFPISWPVRPHSFFLPPFTQVSMLERNNGNCANLSRQSTHTHTRTHIRAFAWLCLFGALCPVLEVSQFTAYVCSLMRFNCLCPVHWIFTCVFASN